MSKKKSSRSASSPSFIDQALSFVPKDMRKQVVKVTTDALKQTEKQRKVLEKDLAKLSKQAQQLAKQFDDIRKTATASATASARRAATSASGAARGTTRRATAAKRTTTRKATAKRTTTRKAAPAKRVARAASTAVRRTSAAAKTTSATAKRGATTARRSTATAARKHERRRQERRDHRPQVWCDQPPDQHRRQVCGHPHPPRCRRGRPANGVGHQGHGNLRRQHGADRGVRRNRRGARGKRLLGPPLKRTCNRSSGQRHQARPEGRPFVRGQLQRVFGVNL